MGQVRFGIGPIRVDEDHVRAAAQALTRALGAPTAISVSPSYADLLDALNNARVDLAWLPPVLCVRAIERGATLLLGCVRAQGKLYHGAIFVREDSDVSSVDRLRGARVAWVDPDSCSGYLFPRAALFDAGFNPTLLGSERMAGSHANVVRAVVSGQVSAGATYLDTLEDGTTVAGWMREAPAYAMRTLLVSAAIPSDAVCANHTMHKDTRDQISRALSDLHRSADGVAMLRDLFEVRRLEPALPRHYNVVREAIGLAGAGPISSTRFR